MNKLLKNGKAEEARKVRAAEEAKKKASAASSTISSSTKASTKSAPASDSEDEDDDHDLKNIRGYKKTSDGRTTSYFTNELDEKTKSLIGDITPKAISAPGAESSAPAPLPSQPQVMTSSWNQAGTWEEKDMSGFTKSKLTELCESASVGAARVKKVKTIEGDAQIVISRGKKRHIYDYNIVLDVEMSLSSENDSEKPTKIKATLTFPEVSPISSYESSVSFKTSIENASQRAAVDGHINALKEQLVTRFTGFNAEYKMM